MSHSCPKQVRLLFSGYFAQARALTLFLAQRTVEGAVGYTYTVTRNGHNARKPPAQDIELQNERSGGFGLLTHDQFTRSMTILVSALS